MAGLPSENQIVDHAFTREPQFADLIGFLIDRRVCRNGPFDLARRLGALFALLAIGVGQTAHAATIDDRPYPMLEFFLAHDCITQDTNVSTLLQMRARAHEPPSADLHRAYFLIIWARRDCAAGRVDRALAAYEQTLSLLCDVERDEPQQVQPSGPDFCENTIISESVAVSPSR